MATYTVKSGDTLSKIAQQFYGDGLKYPAIAMANNISSPYVIHPGQVLTIPNVSAPSSSTTLSPFIARPGSSTANTAAVPSSFAQTFPPLPAAPTTPPVPRKAHAGAKPTPAPSGGFLHSLAGHKKLLIGGAALLAIAAVAGGSRRGK